MNLIFCIYDSVRRNESGPVLNTLLDECWDFNTVLPFDNFRNICYLKFEGIGAAIVFHK